MSATFGLDVWIHRSFAFSGLLEVLRRSRYSVEADSGSGEFTFDPRFRPQLILTGTRRGLSLQTLAMGTMVLIVDYRSEVATLIHATGGSHLEDAFPLEYGPARTLSNRQIFLATPKSLALVNASPKALAIAELVTLLLSRERLVASDPSPQILLVGADYYQQLLSEISVDISKIHSLTPRQFEELVAELLNRDGFEVELTGQTRDGGVDILAHRRERFGTVTYAYECKKYRSDRLIGVRFVRELATAATDNGALAGVLCTTSDFTREALALAERTQIVFPQNITAIHEWIRSVRQD